MNKNLVWVSTASLSHCVPELFGRDREFDVCVHLYDENPSKLDEGELYSWANGGGDIKGLWHYFKPGEKLNVAAAVIPQLMRYHQYAFLDDDLSISTSDLNRLFQVGEALRLPLYQPALTRGSHGSHKPLFAKTVPFPFGEHIDYGVRKVPFVEVMCPFFSASAMIDCLPTFDINESGWGLDCFLWPKAVQERCYVVDGIPIGHYRAPERRMRKLRNGLTPFDELWIQQVCNDPDTAPFKPIGR